MNELAMASSQPIALPAPRVAIVTRVATMDDLPFLDGLQKKHSKALGYFPTKQFEGYIEMGGVLVAWASRPCADGSMGETPMPLGYVISRDRYLKRDELGVIYQLCVAPGHQRGLIGATLVKAVFERSAYGCKLYCCWCAQDLDANRFWESMGFVPIAFRAGSTGKRRVHIFWQRRINADDTGDRATPYWYPCQTNSGAIREDRLVFPIPPGTHWTEVEAVALPRSECVQLEVAGEKRRAPAKPKSPSARRPAFAPMSGFRFESDVPPPQPKPARERAKKVAVKMDPALVGKSRALRDWWMEQANGWSLLAGNGKYDVGRALARPNELPALPLLKAG